MLDRQLMNSSSLAVSTAEGIMNLNVKKDVVAVPFNKRVGEVAAKEEIIFAFYKQDLFKIRCQSSESRLGISFGCLFRMRMGD